MSDPYEMDKLLKAMSRTKKERTEAEKKILEIENYIANIPDAELRMIFEMRVYERKSWIDIAAELALLDDDGEVFEEKDRTTYSKKFNNYLKKFP